MSIVHWSQNLIPLLTQRLHQFQDYLSCAVLRLVLTFSLTPVDKYLSFTLDFGDSVSLLGLLETAYCQPH